ncbi:MAG: aspartate dehydrogenase [Firmicutes bacterium]|nr:aspartate dehydrogenase [Bacillota bacterium]
MFGKKKQVLTFDPAEKTPMLHASICTGETAAGFKDRKTGHFEEVMLIRSDADLKEFMRRYDLKEVPKKEY